MSSEMVIFLFKKAERKTNDLSAVISTYNSRHGGDLTKENDMCNFKKELITKRAGSDLQAMGQILPMVRRHTGLSCFVETNKHVRGGFIATVCDDGVSYEIPARIIKIGESAPSAYKTAIWFNEAKAL